MKHKTAELEGALLDAAVAKAMGLTAESALGFGLGCPDWLERFKPSSSWAHAGPIIERERIGLTWDDIQERWNADLEHAATSAGVQRSFAIGPTAMIAAMRAYVASKLGQEVELP